MAGNLVYVKEHRGAGIFQHRISNPWRYTATVQGRDIEGATLADIERGIDAALDEADTSRPTGTLVLHPLHLSLYFSPEYWHDPAYALQERRQPWRLVSQAERALINPECIPQHPGEYSLIYCGEFDHRTMGQITREKYGAAAVSPTWGDNRNIGAPAGRT